MSGFEAPLPQDGWQRIEDSLNRSAKVVAIRRRFWSAGIAAAIAALVAGGFFLLRQPEVETRVAESSVRPETQASQPADRQPDASLASPEEKPLLAAQSSSVARTAQARNSGKQPHRAILSANEAAVQTATDDSLIARQEPADGKTSVAEQENNGREEFAGRQQKTSQTEVNGEEREKLIREFADAGNGGVLLADAGIKSSRRHKNSAFAFQGKGGLSSYRAEANAPLTLRSAKGESDLASDIPVNSKPPEYASNGLYYSQSPLLNVAENVAEKRHSQPVSFGITVSKSLNDRISLETGLIYTYLYSTTKNTAGSAKNQDSQHFHYLGIPLNVNYVFASFGKLDVYGTLGGMIEKDLYGKANYFDQSQSALTNSASERQITTRIKQETPQLSLSTGLGVSYPLAYRLRLYGKVGGTYYFDAKNEYPTIYSDKKLMLDMNVGLRIEF